MTKLILIRGTSGSGKSTLARWYHQRYEDSVWLEADMYFHHGNGYRFDPTKLREAHDWCQTTARVMLQQGHDVIVSNTFTRIWEMQPYLDMAHDLGVPVTVYRMDQQFENTHGVPETVVSTQRERFEDYNGEVLATTNMGMV